MYVLHDISLLWQQQQQHTRMMPLVSAPRTIFVPINMNASSWNVAILICSCLLQKKNN